MMELFCCKLVWFGVDFFFRIVVLPSFRQLHHTQARRRHPDQLSPVGRRLKQSCSVKHKRMCTTDLLKKQRSAGRFVWKE